MEFFLFLPWQVTAASFLLPLWTPGPWLLLTWNRCLTLLRSLAKSSLSLQGHLFLPTPHPIPSPYLPLPYPFLPPLLNRSLRQWLSQTRPPSWDQEEANAFLMRPWPQCDTVKWQESVAGEPLVQGIYHLTPSDPLGLWEGGNERGGQEGRGWSAREEAGKH